MIVFTEQYNSLINTKYNSKVQVSKSFEYKYFYSARMNKIDPK